jgi:hypothetical protein
VGLAVQREISAQRPAALAGGFRGRGFEDDFLVLVAIEDFGAEHGGLHFGAILVGGVGVDDAQVAGVYVNFDGGMRAGVCGAAVEGCADFVFVSEAGEGAGLADVDGNRGLLGVNVALLGAQAQSAEQDHCQHKQDSPHRSPRMEFQS